jgi:hypothetical protein
MLLPALIVVLPAWAVLLRLAERQDKPVTQRPALPHIEELARYEDFVTQNPFAVVGFVKPGLLRLVTIRVVTSAIGYAARHVYNHGGLAGIKTIHFARWVPLDGWRRMTFASTYDGAVEAYNDDFIDKVWWGLNASFSNAVGYPPTRWLFWGGHIRAAVQVHLAHPPVPVPVWYTAYPSSARPISRTTPRSSRPARRHEPAEAEQWLSLL